MKSVLGYMTLGIGLYLASTELQPLLRWQSGCLASALMLLYILIMLLFELRQLRIQRLKLQG
jgi:hypothetical protein